MYRTALRVVPRQALPARNLLQSPARRFLTTAPPAQKRRSWTNSAVRWGLAVGAVYFYSTSSVFAEEPEVAIRRLDDSIHAVQESNQPTIDAIVEEKRRREAQQAAEQQEKERLARAALEGDEQAEAGDGEEGMSGLEEEADSQGAFNPETGEINWDCPCLGGMAHGPCGEEFRAAFSCFVYSNEEPKGVECIEKFKGMQDCFRQHPEMYGSELEDDEDELEDELLARENAPSGDGENAPPSPSTQSAPPVAQKTTDPSEPKRISEESPHDSQRAKPASTQTDDNSKEDADSQTSGEKDDELIPKAAHDATRK